VRPDRNQQQRASGVRPGSASNVPSIKKQIPTKKPAPQPQPGTFTDYKLVSTNTDVLHHVMRFHGTKEIDLGNFTQPVKLHRKKSDVNFGRGGYNNSNNGNGGGGGGGNFFSKYNHYGKDAGGGSGGGSGDKKDGGAGASPSGGGASAGPTSAADTSLIAPYGGGVRNKQMLFKKRTRQIYIANEEERKKKEIESAPWVIEDDDAQNNWTGQLEGGQHANYVLFVFSTDGFKVVPADKWYKFTPKIQYATLTAEEAEEQVNKETRRDCSVLPDAAQLSFFFFVTLACSSMFCWYLVLFSIKKHKSRTIAASVG
jgi:transcription initiation factor TFIIF subunit alpha